MTGTPELACLFAVLLLAGYGMFFGFFIWIARLLNPPRKRRRQ